MTENEEKELLAKTLHEIQDVMCKNIGGKPIQRRHLIGLISSFCACSIYNATQDINEQDLFAFNIIDHFKNIMLSGELMNKTEYKKETDNKEI